MCDLVFRYQKLLCSLYFNRSDGKNGSAVEFVNSSVLTRVTCVVQLNQSCSLLFKQVSRPAEN